jgi:hypothetical protein
MFNSNYPSLLTTSDLLFQTLDLPSLFGDETLNGAQLDLLSNGGSKLKTSTKTENEDFHILKFKLPGYEKEEIKITIENLPSSYRGSNFIFLKVKVTAENKEEGLLKLEKYFPSSIDQSTVKASLKNGVLTLTAQKDPLKQSERQIQIV